MYTCRTAPWNKELLYLPKQGLPLCYFFAWDPRSKCLKTDSLKANYSFGRKRRFLQKQTVLDYNIFMKNTIDTVSFLQIQLTWKHVYFYWKNIKIITANTRQYLSSSLMNVLHPLLNIGDIGKRKLSSLNSISQRLKGGSIRKFYTQNTTVLESDARKKVMLEFLVNLCWKRWLLQEML